MASNEEMNTPDEVEVLPPVEDKAAPSDAPQPPEDSGTVNAVVVEVQYDEAGNVTEVDPKTLGDVRATEIETILHEALRVWLGRLGR